MLLSMLAYLGVKSSLLSGDDSFTYASFLNKERKSEPGLQGANQRRVHPFERIHTETGQFGQTPDEDRLHRLSQRI
jgi:hypothetical protein